MKIYKTILLTLFVLNSYTYGNDQTLLLRQPDLSEDNLAFVYAGDIWVSKTDGSNPRRLTSSPATETSPLFSPDGKTIAFLADNQGNRDVYIIPTAGGQPKRLTFHPWTDSPQEWSTDGKFVRFVSARETDHGRSRQLYQVSIDGGAPEKVMEARITQASTHPKTGELAYTPFSPAYNGLFGGSSGWKGYQGGTVPEIWVLNADKSNKTVIDGADATNIYPMWIGENVYFISDREDKLFNLFRHDFKKQKTQKVTNQQTWDIRAARAHGKTIVYEAGGRIFKFDSKSKKSKAIEISINPDLPQLRKQWKPAGSTITNFDLSKTGKRALITARGEVFSVPVKDGSTRNLSKTAGKHEYTAIWAPDGSEIAMISETDDMQQNVCFVDQFGKTTRDPIVLGASFHRLIQWVDSEENPKIVYADNHLGLFILDINSGESTHIATSSRRSWAQVSASPDANWIAYTLEKPNFNSDLMLYNIETAKSTILSDGMANVGSTDFSADGNYLYFTASVNSGPVAVGLNMTSREHPLRSGVYAVVLAADGKSPLVPETGDETLEEEEDEALDTTDAEADATDSEDADGTEEDSDDNADEPAEEDKEATKTQIDLDGIQTRIVSIPVAERQIHNLRTDKDGNLFYLEVVQPGSSNNPPGTPWGAENRLMRYDIEELEENEVCKAVVGFSLSADKGNLLIEKSSGSLEVSPVGKTLDSKPVSTSGCKIHLNPREEWVQIFDELWRMEKDYFYASNLHGLDWDAIYQQYRPLVDHVGRREDLNELMVEMIAELHAGHNRTGGGDVHRESTIASGLLGCNFEIENNRYKVSQVYHAAPWYPFLESPLTVPGHQVQDGEYILAIDNNELTAADNIFEWMQETVGKQVTLTVASSADAEGEDRREVIVTPISDESELRMTDWVERNRKYVDEATDGKVAYIYLPNTAGDGYYFFNRMFFAQLDKQAMIIDERANGGGHAADYIIETLARKHLSGWADRDGLTYNTPNGAFHGPKLMMIDQDAGSGGDYLPYMFRYTGAGKLLGTRTWGGLIGISANPNLIDGGYLTVPFFRFFDAQSNWSIENEGVTPDIEVPLCPIAANAGKDNQLDAAIEEIMQQLEAFTPVVPAHAPALPTELGE